MSGKGSKCALGGTGQAIIRNVVDHAHVGESDEEVTGRIRKAFKKGADPCLVRAGVRYGLREHKKNRAFFIKMRF